MKFKFIIPFFNCEDKIENTIFSVLAQSFKDWTATFINDLSTDNSENRLSSIVSNLPVDLAKKICIHKNEEKQGEVVNTLMHTKIIEDPDNTIVVRLDGGDWLLDADILHILNIVYQNSVPVDVAWTNHRWAYTNYNISGPLKLSSVYPDVYTHPWVSSHLKTFRASRLLSVPEGNFKDEENNFITIACDQAIFLPMMHQSIQEERQLVYIPICAYHYDIDLEKPNLFHQPRSYKQKASAEFIRQRGYVQ